MNDLQIFSNPEFGSIRTLDEDGKALFCASDVAKALGYGKPSDAVSRHCRYTTKRGIPHPQAADKIIEMMFIPEGDVIRLITHSNLPNAERFDSWAFDEVLPQVLRTGSYSIAPKMDSLQALNLLVQSLNAQQDAMNRLQVNVDAQSAAIEKLEEQNELNRQAFTMNPGNWRENATAVVGSIVRKKTGGEMKGSGPVYEEVWNEIYGMMKSEFHKDMKRRKMNLEKEFPKRKFSNLEVIDRAGDRNQLISILQSVLCKMCIRYGVRLDMDRAKIVASKPDDAQTSLFERGA